jgi:diguanylate cyclase (GGDEF)-like protein
MSRETRLSKKLRPRIYKNTLLAILAYAISAVIAFSSVYLELSFYSYLPFYIILAFVIAINLCFLMATYLQKNITKRFSDLMLIIQLALWFVAYTATLFYMANLRILMLMASVMAFTFAVNYLALRVSIGLVLLVSIIYVSISYIGIYYFGQPGSLSYEVLALICYIPVCTFVSYMSDRVKQHRKLLKSTVTQLKNAREERELIMLKLEKAASTDDLTGLMNRRAINQELRHEFNRFRRYKTELTILLADIDHFKDINDTFGHDCGDTVLKTISRELQQSIRETDFAARWGGEEFLIVLPDTDLSNARIFAQRLLFKIAGLKVTYQNNTINFTISAGLLQASKEHSIEEAIKMADNFLYDAKKQGRNRIVDQTVSS